MPSPDHAAIVSDTLAYLYNYTLAAKADKGRSEVYADGRDALAALVADLERVTAERDEARRGQEAQRCRAEAHVRKWVESNAGKAEERAERAERQRDQAIEALREIGTPTSTGSRTIQSIRRYARDVLANIESKEKPINNYSCPCDDTETCVCQ